MITTQEEKTFNILKHDLSRFLPIRVVIREQNGKIEGLVEHSFSMDWSDNRINIFWSGKAYSMLGEHQLDAIKWAEGNCHPSKGETIIDPLLDDSPITIDWEKWLNGKTKFDKRNAPFKVKEWK